MTSFRTGLVDAVECQSLIGSVYSAGVDHDVWLGRVATKYNIINVRILRFLWDSHRH